MCNRFLKLNLDNEESDFLAINHPNAFILLFHIAKRARRVSGNKDGLIIGDALIGSNDLSPGMSRQNFRTALDRLVEFGYVQIVYNGKKFIKREKSTINLTIKGTLVNLCNSKIWDINIESTNHQSNQQLTNDQPTANHEQEGIRRDIPNGISRNAQSAARPRTKDSLNFDFTILQFVGITEDDRKQWQTIYSHIVLDVEIAKATEWVKSNPTRAKKLWRKFLTGWLGRANDSAQNKKAYSYASSNSTDRRTKDINGVPVENIHAGRF